MKPPKSRKAELAHNAMGGGDSHAEAAESAELKMTELGPIPVDWEVKRFDECFTLMRNNTYARECLTDHSGSVANVHYGDILVKYGAVLDFVKDSIPYLKPGVKPNKDLLKDGDIIFADTAEDETAGKAVEVQGMGDGKAVAGLHTVACRPNEGIFASRYLGYYINSVAYHSQLLPLMTGTKVSSVSRAGFVSTYLALPPLAEQRRIAGALSDVDELISALGKLIEKKRNIKTGAMQQLLTGKTRLPGFKGKWVEKRLGDCGSFSKGAGISRAQANSGKIPAVRYGELYTTHHDYIKAFESFISDDVARESTKLTCGDIVFACSGETKEEIGRCAAFLGEEAAYAGGDLIILSPKGEYDSKFLAFELNTPFCASQKAAAGQGDAVVHIRRESLEELVVRIPSTLAEQKAIAAVLSDMDAEIAALEADRAKYERIKSGMMQELLTGKTRLKGE